MKWTDIVGKGEAASKVKESGIFDSLFKGKEPVDIGNYRNEMNKILNQLDDKTKERNHLPSLDLYYQQNLKNDQRLIFNLVGTYIKSSNTRIYQEKQEGIANTELYSDIAGKKYSLIAEGIYEKKLEQGTQIGRASCRERV